MTNLFTSFYNKIKNYTYYTADRIHYNPTITMVCRSNTLQVSNFANQTFRAYAINVPNPTANVKELATFSFTYERPTNITTLFAATINSNNVAKFVDMGTNSPGDARYTHTIYYTVLRK